MLSKLKTRLRSLIRKSEIEHDLDKERSRDARGSSWLQDLWQDSRYGARTLGAKPGFTLAVTLSIALGIGFNTTVFTWINALLFSPLPGVSSAGELVTLHSVLERSGGNIISVSYPDYIDFRDRNKVCAGLAASSISAFSFNSGEGQPERVWGLLVSGNYFDVLGVRAAMGRTFAREEDQTPDAAQVAVISHGLWQRRFGADPNLIGKTFRLNERNFTVIGVASPGFVGSYVGLTFDVWIPLAMQKEMRSAVDLRTNRGSQWLDVTGRLKHGVGFAEAQADMQAIARQLEQAYPLTNEGVSARIFNLAGEPYGVQALQPVLAILLAMAGLMLLVVCVNIAGLLLVRAVTRRKEIGVRMALGASRGRVVRQLLTENLLPTCLGGAAGLLLSRWLANALPALMPPIQAPIGFNFKINAPVLAFTLAATLLTALICGLAPALRASKVDMVSTLKDEAGTLAGAARQLRLRSVLVVAQLALSLVLLICAGLFIRSLRQTGMVHPGFNSERVWMATFDLFANGYDGARGKDFYRQFRRRIAALPGVETVSLANSVPPYFSAHNMTGVEIEGYMPRRDEKVVIQFDCVGPDYFETMQIPLIAGRGINEADDERAAPVVVVSELMARQYWPGQSPVGRRLRLGAAEWHEVIGVARDVKQYGPTEQTPPFMYFSLLQNYYSTATALVRTRGEASNWREEVRREVRALDTALPVFDEKTLEAHSGIGVFDQRLAVSFSSGFGFLTLLLAAIGLYGVVAYVVAARTREIGIRLALGARNSDVVKLTLWNGARLIVVGVAIGLAAAFAVAKLLEGFLFGVSVTDFVTFACVAALLSGVALLACYVPARRAMTVDPMVALREE